MTRWSPRTTTAFLKFYDARAGGGFSAPLPPPPAMPPMSVTVPAVNRRSLSKTEPALPRARRQLRGRPVRCHERGTRQASQTGTKRRPRRQRCFRRRALRLARPNPRKMHRRPAGGDRAEDEASRTAVVCVSLPPDGLLLWRSLEPTPSAPRGANTPIEYYSAPSIDLPGWRSPRCGDQLLRSRTASSRQPRTPATARTPKTRPSTFLLASSAIPTPHPSARSPSSPPTPARSTPRSASPASASPAKLGRH